MQTRIKEHVPKCVKDHVKNQPKKISYAFSNAIKRSSISEHLVKNPVCGKNYNKMRFKILKSCSKIFDKDKIEAIYSLKQANIMQAKRICLFVIPV